MAELQPLLGRKIVVTRPAGQAADFCARLIALGAEPVLFPTVTIQPADPAPLDVASKHLNGYDWIVFTSVNGVAALFDRLAANSLEAASMRRPRIAAIGPKTAAALAARGVRVDAMPEEYVAEAVVPVLGDVAGKRVLLPRADMARKALADELRARGAQVEEIDAYRTVPSASPAPDLSEVDAITFTASSTVRGFMAGLEASGQRVPQNTTIVCIGPITAETCHSYGLPVAAVATVYTIDGLIEALIGVFAV